MVSMEAFMTEEKRARRVRDKLRMKAKARRVYPSAGQRAEHWADYLRICSCMLCTGSRHVHGAPIREKRAPAFHAD